MIQVSRDRSHKGVGGQRRDRERRERGSVEGNRGFGAERMNPWSNRQGAEESNSRT